MPGAQPLAPVLMFLLASNYEHHDPKHFAALLQLAAQQEGVAARFVRLTHLLLGRRI
jgi:hypothetical protein